MSRRLAWLVAVLLVVAAGAGGYLGVLAPRRAAVARVTNDVTQTRDELDLHRALAARVASAEKVRAADLFQLSRALPSRVAMQDIVLQLVRLAKDSGVSIGAISPRDLVTGGGYDRVPLSVGLAGSYAAIEKFLDGVRGLVDVDDGRLSAHGRLFTVESVSLTTTTPGLPTLDATVSLDAYVLADPSAAPAPAAGTPSLGGEQAGLPLPAPTTPETGS